MFIVSARWDRISAHFTTSRWGMMVEKFYHAAACECAMVVSPPSCANLGNSLARSHNGRPSALVQRPKAKGKRERRKAENGLLVVAQGSAFGVCVFFVLAKKCAAFCSEEGAWVLWVHVRLSQGCACLYCSTPGRRKLKGALLHDWRLKERKKKNL